MLPPGRLAVNLLAHTLEPRAIVEPGIPQPLVLRPQFLSTGGPATATRSFLARFGLSDTTKLSLDSAKYRVIMTSVPRLKKGDQTMKIKTNVKAGATKTYVQEQVDAAEQ
ncbi:MAG: hypothetical protein DRJ65_08920 [Acidobacteria bacterium]|nr:MAG: hypothetical protein DRJ65_08920 [Acidobacteriota bacterium]